MSTDQLGVPAAQDGKTRERATNASQGRQKVSYSHLYARSPLSLVSIDKSCCLIANCPRLDKRQKLEDASAEDPVGKVNQIKNLVQKEKEDILENVF